MLFKNLMLFCYADKWQPGLEAMEAALDKARFTPCAASQAQSVGWVEPRGIKHSALVEPVNGQYLLRLLVEEKSVPASVVKTRLQDVCDKIEKDTGRRPGRQYQRELKEQIILELLPQAFPRQRGFNVWLEPKNRWLLIDASSLSSAGRVITALAKTFEGLAVHEMQAKTAPALAMSHWLLNEAPGPFTVDMDCELRSDSEAKPLVRHAHMPLDTNEIRQHIEQGMYPARLALDWQNRIWFALTHDLKIKGIQFLDGIFEGHTDDSGDVFDADAAIAIGELLPMLQDLLGALGGEVNHA